MRCKRIAVMAVPCLLASPVTALGQSLRSEAGQGELNASVQPLTEVNAPGKRGLLFVRSGTFYSVRDGAEEESRVKRALLGAGIGAVAGYFLLFGTRTMNPGAALLVGGAIGLNIGLAL